jgi:hypothetical protein
MFSEKALFAVSGTTACSEGEVGTLTPTAA